MTYVQQPWVPNVTPVDAAHMLHIEAGIAAALAPAADGTYPLSGAVADLGRGLYNYTVLANASGDTTQYRFTIQNSGHLFWGPGGSTATDTNLYRSGVGTLRTDGILYIGGAAVVDNAGAGAKLYFGSALDTTLYRQAAGVLRTDSQLWVNDQGVKFGSAGDTILWRPSANSLRTEGTLAVVSGVYAGYDGTNWGVILGNPLDGLTLGNDATLYRDSAASLTTNGAFSAGGGIWSQRGATQISFGAWINNQDTWEVLGSGKMNWGDGTNALDTNLYRSAGGVLKTDGGIVTTDAGSGVGFWYQPATVTGYVIASRVAGEGQSRWFAAMDGSMSWGPGGAGVMDTTLFRYSPGNLKTGGGFYVNNGLVVDAASTGQKLWLGGALDTNLYRSAAGVLKTDGVLNAVGGLQINGKSAKVLCAYIDSVGNVTGNRGVSCVVFGTGSYQITFPAMSTPVVVVTPTSTLTYAAAQLVSATMVNVFTTAGGVAVNSGLQILIMDANG